MSPAIGNINDSEKDRVVSYDCCSDENEWFRNCASTAVKALPRYTTVDTVGTLVGTSLGLCKHGE